MKVVDASALAAVVFEEPEADRVAGCLHGVSLIAPHLLRYELTNVCLTKCRRHSSDRDELIRRLDCGLRFGVEEVPVDHDAVLTLALETKLSAYDSSYLWLALQLDAELVTLDDRLAQDWTALAKRWQTLRISDRRHLAETTPQAFSLKRNGSRRGLPSLFRRKGAP